MHKWRGVRRPNTCRKGVNNGIDIRAVVRDRVRSRAWVRHRRLDLFEDSEMNAILRWIRTVGFCIALPFLILWAFVAAVVQVVFMKMRLL
jgi:hypothetical protein